MFNLLKRGQQLLDEEAKRERTAREREEALERAAFAEFSEKERNRLYLTIAEWNSLAPDGGSRYVYLHSFGNCQSSDKFTLRDQVAEWVTNSRKYCEDQDGYCPECGRDLARDILSYDRETLCEVCQGVFDAEAVKEGVGGFGSPEWFESVSEVKL